MPQDFPLDEGQMQRVVATTRACIATAASAFGLARLAPVEITFDVRGSAWGYYVRDRDRRRIRYNPWLFARYFEDGLNETVPHEVAHYVVEQLHPGRRVAAHGAEWRAVMRLFGFSTPRATHRHSLDGIPVRRQQRFLYRCGCRQHELSTTRHLRILGRRMEYRCRACGEILRAMTG